MEPQIDIFWLLVAGVVTAVVRGLYRRIRNFPAFAWKFTNVSYICNAIRLEGGDAHLITGGFFVSIGEKYIGFGVYPRAMVNATQALKVIATGKAHRFFCCL